MSHGGRVNLSDASLDSILKNLTVWSESLGGQKAKPSQVQQGVSLLAGIGKPGNTSFVIRSTTEQYQKLLATLKIVLANLEAKELSPSAVHALQRFLQHMLMILRVQAPEAQDAEAKVRNSSHEPSETRMELLHGKSTARHSLPLLCMLCAQARMVIELRMHDHVARVHWKLVGVQGGKEGSGACRRHVCTALSFACCLRICMHTLHRLSKADAQP